MKYPAFPRGDFYFSGTGSGTARSKDCSTGGRTVCSTRPPAGRTRPACRRSRSLCGRRGRNRRDRRTRSRSSGSRSLPGCSDRGSARTRSRYHPGGCSRTVSSRVRCSSSGSATDSIFFGYSTWFFTSLSFSGKSPCCHSMREDARMTPLNAGFSRAHMCIVPN